LPARLSHFEPDSPIGLQLRIVSHSPHTRASGAWGDTKKYRHLIVRSTSATDNDISNAVLQVSSVRGRNEELSGYWDKMSKNQLASAIGERIPSRRRTRNKNGADYQQPSVLSRDKRANRRKCMVYAARALMVGYRESKGGHDGNANDEVAID
jgi:hypothetical protein